MMDMNWKGTLVGNVFLTVSGQEMKQSAKVYTVHLLVIVIRIDPIYSIQLTVIFNG